jgi:hypothetical protein
MPSDLESLTPGARRSVIERWIGLNILYAKARRERYRAQGSPDKEAHWEVWESFHDHALQELRDGRLDAWMDNLHDPDFDPTRADRPTVAPTPASDLVPKESDAP